MKAPAVTITGCDFGDTQETSFVSFGGVQAVAYTSWSDTEIVVGVPDGAMGDVMVTVTTPAGTSNGAVFSAQAPVAPCGEGGGMAVMMLGITLGLLSVAGGFRLRRRKR